MKKYLENLIFKYLSVQFYMYNSQRVINKIKICIFFFSFHFYEL